MGFWVIYMGIEGGGDEPFIPGPEAEHPTDRIGIGMGIAG